MFEVTVNRLRPLAAILVALLIFSSGCNRDAAEPEPTPLTGPRIRVLGSVQDGGLPHAACTCTRCSAARHDPARRRHVASLAVIAEDRAYVIDATPDFREQLHDLRDVGTAVDGKVDRAPVDGILLTHAHLGHYTGLAFLGFEAVHSGGIPVFCTPSLANFLRTNGPWSQLVDLGNIEVRESVAGRSFDLEGGIEVTPVPVPHRDEYADTVGFLLRGPRSTVLYVPDTDNWESWDPPVVERLAGIDIAIVDGTFFSADELPGRRVSEIGHPLITRSLDLLEPLVRSGKTRIYFTHLNHSNPALDPDGEALREIERRGFHVLRDGDEFPL